MTTWHLAQLNVGQLRAPTIDEAEDRLTALQTNGPSREAFTFMLTFPPPDQSH